MPVRCVAQGLSNPLLRSCFKAVKADGPDDLVFQSVATGAPMRDNNILCRHIKPAARGLGLGWVNWQVLRRSCATWLQQAGVDIKDAQGLMRHSRASTTQDVYQQVVPESQQQAVRKLSAYALSARNRRRVWLQLMQPIATI